MYRVTSKMRGLAGSFVRRTVVLALIFGCFAFFSGEATAVDSTFTVRNTNPVLELTVPGAIYLDLAPNTGSDFDIANLEISVGTNNPTGYALSMTASSTSLTRVGSATDIISPMSIEGSSTGYTAAQFESSDTDTYTLNRWGYKLSTATNFMPVTANTIELATTSTSGNATTTTLNLAAKVDATMTAGAYQTTLNFTAVTNALPLTISDLEYMQDFIGLTYTERGEVLDSMTTGTQYQLKDSRDEKPYYISKLADGNVWMTQNLDHDIVTTSNFYTYHNTDIGHGNTLNPSASWTASTATYATGITTWDTTSTGFTTPQSYDPGNVCWSGTTEDSTTVSCTQSDIHFHLGNFYDWTAAVAMNDSSSYTANGTDADQSICPAGWTLPKDGSITTSGSFQYLVAQYGWDSDDKEMTGTYSMWDSPLYFPLAGDWDGSLEIVFDYGNYWSSVVYNSNFAYLPGYDYDGAVDPDDIYNREYGASVRCVLRDYESFTGYIMQEVDEWGDDLEVGDEVVATDSRDGKTYTVAKLGDGNIWMTQNLDHNIVTVPNFYTYYNTDIGHGSTPNTSETWTASNATYSTSDTSWYDVDSARSNPESYDPGDLCWDGSFNGSSSSDYTIAMKTGACSNDKHYHLGNYYNWTAAVAMNNSSSYTSDLTNVGQSICPAGWTLPNYSGDKSYDDLVNDLALVDGEEDGNIDDAPVYFVYGGAWEGSSTYVGRFGYYWVPVAKSGSQAYQFFFSKYEGDINTHLVSERDGSGLIRCVAR